MAAASSRGPFTMPGFDSLSVSAADARDEQMADTGPDDNVTAILEKLTSERRVFNLPIIVFLVFLAAFGLAGNVCVLHVYRTRFRKTAGSFFIMTLAILDLLGCALSVPFDIFDLYFPYTNAIPVACKIFRFIEYYTTMAAGLTLTCVAFSRYFKIVNPLHCYSAGQARSLVIVTTTVALSVVWPQLVLSGTRTVPTRVLGVLGQACDVSDGAAGTVYPLIFHSVLLAVFFLCFSIMIVFYSRILCVVWKRSCTQIGEHVPSARRGTRVRRRRGSSFGCSGGPAQIGRRQSSESNNCGGGGGNASQSPISRGRESDSSLSSSQTSISTIYRPTRQKHQAGRRKSWYRRKRQVSLSSLGRTTRMLGLVTAMALLSYVPFLTVQVVALTGVGFQTDAMTSYSEQLAFQFCLKSHFLSSAANPLIYSILSPNFRKESMVALKCLLSWVIRPGQ